MRDGHAAFATHVGKRKGGSKNQSLLQASVLISSVRPMACNLGLLPVEQHRERT